MLKKIPIKYFMALYLAFIFIFSSMYFEAYENLWKGFVMVGLYAFFDVMWTYLRDKVWYFPLSSFISGLVLANVAIASPEPVVMILLPLVAVISKQILKFGKMRHVYNPGAFSMALVGFFFPTISWWGVAWGNPLPMLAIISIVGLFILLRQNRFHVTLPFLLTYAVGLSLIFLADGTAIGDVLLRLKPQILDGTTLFFATVMLIEPLTSTFPTQNKRIMYGISVGVFAVLLTYLGRFVDIPGPLDPLVYGLCLGNLVCSLAFLPGKKKPMVAPASPVQI